MISRLCAPAVAAALLVATVACGGDDPSEETRPPPQGPAPEAAPAAPAPEASEPARTYPQVRWRRSRSIGRPYDGRLVNGVMLPREGRHFFTWDPVRWKRPNRAYRRWGNDRLVRRVLRVLREFAAAHPSSPRIGVGDLSRRRGGDFGPQFGGIGHVSHQNGLDVDVYYPRRDRRERGAKAVRKIDRRLSQDLVTRFVSAGAKYVFVGPDTSLTGPRRIVQELAHHNDHLHFRMRRSGK